MTIDHDLAALLGTAPVGGWHPEGALSRWCLALPDADRDRLITAAWALADRRGARKALHRASMATGYPEAAVLLLVEAAAGGQVDVQPQGAA